jgi:hypothetical protein
LASLSRPAPPAPGRALEYAAVSFPPVEHRVGVPAEVGRRCRRVADEQRLVADPADDDAHLPVACQQYAKPAGVQVEAVGLGQPRERAPREYDLELQPLKLVRGLHDDSTETVPVQLCPQPVLLVVMRHADRHLLRPQRDRPRLPLAARVWGEVEQLPRQLGDRADASVSAWSDGGQLQAAQPERVAHVKAASISPALDGREARGCSGRTGEYGYCLS